MQRHMRRWSAGVFAAAAVGLVSVLSGSATGATSLSFVHSGQAWGIKVQVGTVIVSSPSAVAAIGSCAANTGVSAEKSAASVNVPNTVTSSTNDSRVETGSSATGTFTRSTSTVESANVFAGMITATSLQALSEVRYTTGSGFSFKNASTAVSLTINGTAITVSAPNARFELPGTGYVVVNEQTRTQKANFASQEVNLLHVHVTDVNNPLHLAVGTDITVGHAVAALTAPLPVGGLVNGTATGVYYKEGNIVKIGQSPHASIPCLGGSSSSTVASVSMPNRFSNTTLKVTAQGTVGQTKTVGHTTSTVDTVNLLGGVVKATGVKAVAHGEYNGSSYALNSNGSTIASLTVNGKQVSPKVNAVIKIAGVGSLSIYRVTKGTKSIAVKMLELVLASGNTAGLPAGTTMRVATANVSFP